MDLLFTAIALTALCGCLLAYTRCSKAADLAHGHYLKAEAMALTLKAERDRVTVLERDLEALRRELRKLSGKVYAAQRTPTVIEGEFEHRPTPTTPACENWLAAQLEGPRSKAASCECTYCATQRRIRAVEKAAILAARQAKPVNGGE